jgi:hypothetical protein
MPQKQPPTRSVARAVVCFLIAAAFYGWVIESIVRGRVAFDTKYGHVEHHGIGGILAGLFLSSVGSAAACFGFANLRPDRGSALALRAGIFSAAGFACLLLALLVEGLGS